MNYSKHIKFIAASVAFITFIVYLPALRNGFVTWDDDIYVFENYHLLSWNAAFFKWAFLDFYASNWHPLTWISHALDYTFWGLNPLGHHLTNIVLHAVNAFLVALLAGRLLESYLDRIVRKAQTSFLNNRALLTAAGVTGLLFGLHPVHVESVAWVSERKDLLCALFFLLSVITYLKYAGSRLPSAGVPPAATKNPRPKAGKRPSRQRILAGQAGMTASERIPASYEAIKPGRFFTDRHYLVSLAFFALALLCKPMAVSLPLVLLLLDWHPFDRIKSLKTSGAAFVEKTPFIALSLGSSIITMMAQKTGGAMDALESVPLSIRLPVAAQSLIAYLGKMLWPFDLLPYYMYPHEVSVLTFGYLAAIFLAFGITGACVVLAGKRKMWLSAWGYYIVTLLPVIGIVQVGIQSMADRYTYLPSLGLFLVLGTGVAWLSEKAVSDKGIAVKVAGGVAAVAFIGLMSSLTIRQIQVWESSMTLWGYIIEKTHQKIPFAHMNRGVALEKAGLLDQAIADYDAAIAQDPDYSKAYANRGVAFEKAGRLDHAIADYKKALTLDPSSAQTHFNLGSLYLGSGRLAEAIEQYNQAIAINPQHADAYHNRGVALSDSGRPGKALEDYNMAILLNRNYDIAYFNRGILFMEQGDVERARADFRMSCDLGYEGGCSALQTL